MTLHRLSSSLLLAASLVLPLPTAQAASFSCSKATTPAERIICDDKDLGARDGLMAGYSPPHCAVRTGTRFAPASRAGTTP